MKNNKIKAAIIVDDGPVPFLISDLIDKSLKQDKYEIVALLVQKKINTKKNIISKILNYISRRGLKKFIESSTFALIKILEKFIVKKYYNLDIIFETRNLDSFNYEKIDVHPKISKSGLIYKYESSDIEKIKEMDIDVLIRGGSGILKGEILNVCTFGVLSFHHAENDINRGGPPGFWEVFYRQKSTGFMIQRLSEELDGGEVVFKGSIKTTFLYMLNWARICIKANYFLHLKLIQLNQSSINERIYPKKPYADSLYTVPSLSKQLQYLFQTLSIVMIKIYRKIFGLKVQWNIAYQFVDSWDNSVLRKSLKIKNPKNRFFADPFVKHYNNRNIIFVEDFDYKKNKAVISAIEINPDKSYTILGPVLDEDFHLSYPYIFEENNELFLCPETHDSNDIRLYKCTEFPMKWEFDRILIKNVSAADSNIFYHENKWWLMTNIDSSDLGVKLDYHEHDSELHIFYADSLNSNNWISHPKNPVIFDSNQARNAGNINSKDGELYRVFQEQSFDTYGKKFGITKILELNTENYKEEILFKVPPNFYNDIFGTHHYSFDNNLIALDYMTIKRSSR